MEKFDWGTFTAGMITGAAGVIAAAVIVEKVKLSLGGPVIITDGSIHVQDLSGRIDWTQNAASHKASGLMTNVTVTSDAGTWTPPSTPTECAIVFTKTDPAPHNGVLVLGSYSAPVLGIPYFEVASLPHRLQDWTYDATKSEHVLANTTITAVIVDNQLVPGTKFTRIEIDF